MSLDGCQAKLVQSTDDAAELLRWLSQYGKDSVLGLDTETTGLSPEVDRVRLVQVGDAKLGWAIPFERWAGVVDDVVRRYEGTWTLHNAPYDVAMLRTGDVHLPLARVRDTRLMAHVLSSTGPLGLKPLSTLYVDPRAAAGQERLDEALSKQGGWTWATVPVTFGPYWQYACLDTIIDVQLHDVLWPRVQADAPASYDLEMAVAWVAERMMRRGVRVDRPYTQAYVDALTAHMRDVEAWCEQHYRLWPGSNRQVIDALRRDGVKLTKLTAGGSDFALDKEVLEELDHPLAAAVLSRRRAEKQVSAWLQKFLDLSARDGLIHASINTIGGTSKNPFEPGGRGKGVRTGRMSISEPSLQNVPIRGETSTRVRNAFIPSEGCTWLKADADQIEMRILAHLSQDPGLIAAFNSSDDFFVTLARQMYDDPTIEKSDPRRQPVKNAGYGKIFGAGPAKVAKTAGVSVAQATAVLTRFDELFPGARRFQRAVEAEAMRTRRETGEAFIRSPLTNRKHVSDEGRDYALVNYVIQGTAGELLKRKMVECDAAGLGDYMTIPVHDEIDFDVPDELVPEVLDTLRDVLNDDQVLSVPLTWSVGVGDRWGNAKD